MMQLSILPLLFCNLPRIFGPSDAKTTSQMQQNELHVDEKQSNMRQMNRMNIPLEKTESTTFRAKNNTGGTAGRMLEGCFGGLSRLLSPSRDKKKDPAEKQRCYCRCCRRLSQKESTKLFQKDAVKCEECCSRIGEGGCKKCIDVNAAKQPGTVIEDTARGLKVSTLRSTNVPTEADRGIVPTNAISSKVQHRDVRGMKRQRRGTNQPPKILTRDQDYCCLEKCYYECIEPPIVCVCGACCCDWPLLCLYPFGKWCCKHFNKLLNKHCKC